MGMGARRKRRRRRRRKEGRSGDYCDGVVSSG